ncbi:MAG: glucose PTS transporter subunit IIA [Coprobacillaceae bacterium]
MTREQTLHEILDAIGGKENIVTAGHCITRLRLTLNNKEGIDLDRIKKIDGVLNTQFSGEQLQIIVGTDVNKYYEELMKIIGGEIKNTSNKVSDAKEKESVINKVMGTISGIFIPASVAIAASGIIKGILALCTVFKWLSVESDVYIVLNMIGDATFYFLPVLLGFSVAKKIETNEYLGASLGALLVYPTLINGATAMLPSLSFFGIPVPYVTYSSSVLPVVLGVFALKYIHNGLKKIIPSALEMVVTGGLAFLITALLTLIVLAPVGNYLGVYISDFFVWLYSWAGPFASMLMGATFAPMVMTGFVYGIFPVVFQNLGILKYDYIVLPMMIYSNVNQGVAAIAAGIKLKDPKIKSAAFGAGLTGLLGITEPAMYTVNLTYKKPFYSALIGSGAAGLLSGILNVKMFTMAGSGLTAIPGFASNEFTSNMINAIICLCIGMVITFVLTFIWTKKEATNEVVNEKKESINYSGENIKIGSIGNGKAIALNQVPDKTFSEGILGEGVAIDIQDGKTYAPFDGEVVALFPTGHAIGLKSKNGVEILVHIGIDTVKLEKGYFTSSVKQGQQVNKGQLLISFDYLKLEAAGVYPSTLLIVSNSQDFQSVKVLEQETYSKEDTVFSVFK